MIPSKDRPAQLHQLLSLIGDNADGIGKITITIQASNSKYMEGYKILQERLKKDDCFKLLRKKSNISISYRGSISEIFNALDNLGSSKLLLVLTDDEIFFGKINFETNLAVKFFLDNPDILSCSIRLGKNITPEVPKTHKYFTRSQPRFIKESDNYLMWSWPDNLDTYHWACIFSTTGNIYRKNEYLEWFNIFGKENFLKIEGSALKYSVNKFFMVHTYLLNIMKGVDFLMERIFKIFTNVNYQPIIFNTFVKYIYKCKIFAKKDASLKMISLSQSITAAIDINTSQKWRGKKSNFIDNKLINKRYLDGYIISKNIFLSMEYNEPNLRGVHVGINFEKYNHKTKHDLFVNIR